jgi:cell division protein ZapA (FtsZ GTPase activity inhibitor)
MTENLIPINIILADRNYRLKINPSDEEKVRKTIKTINDKIIEFRSSFAGKDMQDYVAMVLLWFATEVQKNDSSLIKEADFNEQIQKISELLNKTL